MEAEAVELQNELTETREELDERTDIIRQLESENH